jgi:hypothetical protein
LSGARPALRERSWPWLAIFAGFFLLVFHRFWGHTIVMSDAYNFFAPNKGILLRGLKEGTIYAWNPWLFLGVPFAAEVQAGVFYPFNLLFLLFDFGLAHRLYILLHYPLAAFNMFLFLRRRGLVTAAAAMGGIFFALSGYLVSQHTLVRMLLGAAWAPLAFYFADRALAEGWKWAAAGGAVLALQVFSSDPETAVVTAAIAGGHLLLVSAWQRRPLRGLGLTAAMGACSFLLSAVQVLPTWEMMKQSVRAHGLSYGEAVIYSLHPAQLADFVWPTPFGQSWPVHFYWGGFMLDASAFTNIPWSASNYLGLPVLALAAAGMAVSRRRLRRWLLAGTVFFLLLALGRYAPLYRLLGEVPVLNAFRYPSKYVAWMVLCLAAAAALGFERLREELSENPRGVLRIGLIYTAATAAIAAAAWWLWPMILAAKSPFPSASLLYLQALEHLRASWMHWTVINLLCGLLLVAAGQKRLRPNVALAALGAIVIVDLCLVNVTIMPAGPPGIYAFEPQAARLLRAEGEPLGHYRVYREEWEFRDSNPALTIEPRYSRQAIWQRNTLRRNHSAMSGIEDMVLYGSYELRDGLPLFAGGLSPQILALFNVRYLILPLDAPTARTVKVKTIFSDPKSDLRIDRILNAWPRAFFVPGARAARDEKEAIKLLGAVNLTREAVITTAENLAPAAPAAGGMVAARVADYQPDRVRIEVEAPSAGWLVLSDRCYPGWKAAVDGVPAPIYRANVLVRAVRLERGRHLVEFTYRPLLLRLTAGVSLSAWILLAAGFLLPRFRSKGHSDAEAGG